MEGTNSPIVRLVNLPLFLADGLAYQSDGGEILHQTGLPVL